MKEEQTSAARRFLMLLLSHDGGLGTVPADNPGKYQATSWQMQTASNRLRKPAFRVRKLVTRSSGTEAAAAQYPPSHLLAVWLVSNDNLVVLRAMALIQGFQEDWFSEPS